MRKLALVVLSLLFSSLFLIDTQPTNAQGGILTTTSTIVNLRSGPGTEWRILKQVPQGAAIRLDGQAFQAAWVRGIIADGTVGWLSGELVNESNERLLSLPVTYREDAFTLPAPGAGEVPASGDGTTGGNGAAPASGGPGTATSVSTTVNMRSGPDTEYRIVGVIRSGQTLNVDGRSGNSQWVRGINPDGRVGWVYAPLTSLGGQVGNLPVVNIDTPFGLAAPSVPSAPEQPAGDTATGSTEPLPPVAVVNTAPVRGFSTGGHVRGFGAQAEQAMRIAGMTWIKKQWRYVDGQSSNDASGMIADAHARGFRILIGVVGVSPGDINNSGYFDRYADFVGGLAALGADGIEVWNEPNIDREWPAGQINPATYTQLLRQSYAAIKNANSNTLVVSGAPAPTGFFGGCSGSGCDDNHFLAGMADAGAASFMDCVGIHYNEGIVPPTATSGDPRGNSGHYTRYLPSMMNVYSGAFGGRVPLCFTELGYLSPEGYGPLPGGFMWAENVTVAQHAAWLDGAVNYARSSGRVRLLIVWNVDFTEYGADPMGGYAMIRPDGSCPACVALSQ